MTTRLSHYEWRDPQSYWQGDSQPYAGAIAIQTNYGHLLLCRVDVDVDTGEQVVRLVRPEEIQPAPR